MRAALTALAVLLAIAAAGRRARLALPPAAPPTPDGWVRAGYREAGLDSARIAAMLDGIRAGTYPGIDAVLIARRGRLVVDAYFGGTGSDSLHDLRSATKSVASMLVGAAVARGRLAVDTPVVAFFPEYRAAGGWPAGLARTTVADLLTMRAGRACDDFDAHSPGNEERMYPAADWTQFFFAVPPSPGHGPGERFSYCTAGVALLGELLARATGAPVPAFADSVLFGPLGIARAAWRPTPTGGTFVGGNLHLRPRDMAKLGQVMLDAGRWQGRQVLPAAWVRTSAAPHVREAGDIGTGAGALEYGYLWWRRNPITDTTRLPSYHASGNGGQKIFVVPDAGLVVVFTGRNYNRARYGHAQPVALLNRYVLPALRP
jgi:CubicO group peptidase (beta-lactamase class C family)